MQSGGAEDQLATTRGRPRRRVLVRVGGRCNDRCTFCHTAAVRSRDEPADRIERHIDAAAEMGCDAVVLGGGEPTLRPELPRWAERVARRGLSLGLATNGRMLAYATFVDRLAELGLQFIYLTLPAGDAATHREVTRSDGFEQAVAGLRNCSGRGLELHAECVLTPANADRLAALVELIEPLPEVHLNLAFAGARSHLSLGVAAANVRAAIAHARERGMAGRVGYSGLPLSLLDDVAAPRGGLLSHRFVALADIGGRDLVRLPRPPQPRPNSFHYVPVAERDANPNAPCPLPERRPAAWTPPSVRFIHLLRGHGRLVTCETATSDFDDSQIELVVAHLGQVYDDVSVDKPALDDFSADLRQLVRLPQCRSCELRSACGGCYQQSAEDVFSRDDEAVRSIVRQLAGDVLDLGCGDGRYPELLGALAERGDLRYHGVDPDADAIARLRDRWPLVRGSVARAEDLRLPPDAYDHVLMLRSFNHFAEPLITLDAAVRAVRPGGSLLIVDNVAFALVRSREQAAQAEHGSASFEHYRNDGAWEVAARLRDWPLELLARQDVGPDRSNQWLLHYRRRS